VNLLVRSDLKTTTLTQILGEVLTNNMFKKSQDKLMGQQMMRKRRVWLSRHKVPTVKKMKSAMRMSRMKK